MNVVTKIDGAAVSPADDLAAVLTGPLARDISLTVKPADGPEKTVAIRPITYAAVFAVVFTLFSVFVAPTLREAMDDSVYLQQHHQGAELRSEDAVDE